ncbi:MAG: NADH-ubiquinone oxidoreductase-F iron-sulfur binding region domain-containing protein [Anaerovorax sp.]
MTLKNREDLITMRKHFLGELNKQKKKIYVCAGTGCVAGGSLEIYARLKALIEENNIPCHVQLKEEKEEDCVGLKQSGCHGFCEMGPLLRIEPAKLLYLKVKLEDCEEILEKSILKNEIVNRLVYQNEGKFFPTEEEIPFYKHQQRMVLEDCGQIDAESIEEYISYGGYEALEKCLFDISGEEIIKIISDANLRGRGGGGFPAGRKWTQVRAQKESTKYVVCNGDEGDPGAFMDRSIMEGDPHKMLEGMMVAGVASGAKEGYIYVRAEYPLAIKRLKIAIDDATRIGILGEHILGTDFSFHIKIVKGAGAFVCGEGSALTVSIEGDRGMPRVKPPRTVEQGLYGKPTLLNNVETFANVPLIINKGAAWYKTIGPEKSPGTKAFALTGNIVNTGLIEVTMGTKLGKVIFDIGGGVRDGKTFKAVQIGGPSGGCLTREHLDLPLDFDSLKKVGAMIGSGGLVVMDDDTCMVEVARFFMNFTQNESCGKCVPCREGTRRMLEILERIVAGKGVLSDLDLLEELAETITATALCGLGKTAAGPVSSTLKYFRDEYIAHIVDKKCPTKNCQALKTIYIDESLCKGCTKCAKVCPVNAISGKVKEPFKIIQDKCIKCEACIPSCNFKAIKED